MDSKVKSSIPGQITCVLSILGHNREVIMVMGSNPIPSIDRILLFNKNKNLSIFPNQKMFPFHFQFSIDYLCLLCCYGR